MLCDNYVNGLVEQPGDQPIRVFFDYIEQLFTGIRDSLDRLNPRLGISNVRFEFLTENTKVMGPSTNGVKITIHDTFLSFLWTYAYSIVVTAPIGGKNLTSEQNQIAYNLRKFSLELMTGYKHWDKESLPNPELCDKDPDGLIGVTNAVFMEAVRFILLHEFAHIFLGHTRVLQPLRTPENLFKMEKDADTVAANWCLQYYITEQTSFTGRIGMITALNSISYSPSKFNAGAHHPSPEDRLSAILETMRLQENDYMWGYSIWSLLQWQVNFEIFWLPHKTGHTQKEMFFEQIEWLKKYKERGYSTFRKKGATD